MTIEEAIASYLVARKAQGLPFSEVKTLGRALHTAFEPVLTEHIAILTADQMNELRASAGASGSPPGRTDPGPDPRPALERVPDFSIVVCPAASTHC